MTEQMENQTSDLQVQFPKGFCSCQFQSQIKFSAEYPTIEREVLRGGDLVLKIPVFITSVDGGYCYIPVPINYVGQDVDHYDKCVLQSYKSLRKYFYGTDAFQRDLEYDDLLNQHITAVKTAFPKPNGVVVKKYSKYKIQRACEALEIAGHGNIWEELEEAIKAAGKWSSWQNIQDIRSDNEELLAVLPAIRQMFPMIDVDKVLDDCIC